MFRETFTKLQAFLKGARLLEASSEPKWLNTISISSKPKRLLFPGQLQTGKENGILKEFENDTTPDWHYELRAG